MKEQGVIRESNSPWSSPIVLVRKKSGKIRPCIDYRKVNSVNKLMPSLFQGYFLDAASEVKLFSTFDLTSWYFQILVKKRWYTEDSLWNEIRLYEFTCMLFCLCNSAATFKRVMEIALIGLQWLTCLVYIDDIIAFGRYFKEHMRRIEDVLDRKKTAGLKLKPEKCELLQKEVCFLAHVINEKGILPNPDNVTKVLSCSVPKSATDVRQF